MNRWRITAVVVAMVALNAALLLWHAKPGKVTAAQPGAAVVRRCGGGCCP